MLSSREWIESELRVNFDLFYKGLVAMLTLKRHLTLKGTDLFFSLIQTLPDFGFPRGILLRFLPSSVVLGAAMLFHVLTDARTWVSRFTIGSTSLPHSTWRPKRSNLDGLFSSLQWCFSTPNYHLLLWTESQSSLDMFLCLLFAL